ncbi:MAG: hypothetical protein LBJ36_06220 [Synergistaceae bacterium]|nr:hypothetical protein [Synergistaceae bacterium]
MSTDNTFAHRLSQTPTPARRRNGHREPSLSSAIGAHLPLRRKVFQPRQNAMRTIRKAPHG